MTAFGALVVVGLPGPAAAAPAAHILWGGPVDYRPSRTATVVLTVTVTTPAAPHGFSLRIHDATVETRCRAQGADDTWPVAAATTATIEVPVVIACNSTPVAATVEHLRAELVPDDAPGHPVASAERVLRPVATPAIRVDHPPAVTAGASSVFAAAYVNDTDIPVHAGDVYAFLRLYDPDGSEGYSRVEWSAGAAGPWTRLDEMGPGLEPTPTPSPITYELPTLDVPAHGTSSFWLRYTPTSGVRTGRVSITGGWDMSSGFVPIDGIDVTNPAPHLAADQCWLAPPCRRPTSAAPLYCAGVVLALILLVWGIRRVMRATAAARARS